MFTLLSDFLIKRVIFKVLKPKMKDIKKFSGGILYDSYCAIRPVWNWEYPEDSKLYKKPLVYIFILVVVSYALVRWMNFPYQSLVWVDIEQ